MENKTNPKVLIIIIVVAIISLTTIIGCLIAGNKENINNPGSSIESLESTDNTEEISSDSTSSEKKQYGSYDENYTLSSDLNQSDNQDSIIYKEDAPSLVRDSSLELSNDFNEQTGSEIIFPIESLDEDDESEDYNTDTDDGNKDTDEYFKDVDEGQMIYDMYKITYNYILCSNIATLQRMCLDGTLDSEEARLEYQSLSINMTKKAGFDLFVQTKYDESSKLYQRWMPISQMIDEVYNTLSTVSANSIRNKDFKYVEISLAFAEFETDIKEVLDYYDALYAEAGIDDNVNQTELDDKENIDKSDEAIE